MDYNLTDEMKMLRETAYKFAVQEIAPVSKAMPEVHTSIRH